MTKTLLIPFLLCLAGCLVTAQQRASPHGNETLLIALENAWNQAQLHHDSLAPTTMASSRPRLNSWPTTKTLHTPRL